MQRLPGQVLVKSGAEGVYCGAFAEQGLGFALKIDDGAKRAAEAAVVQVIARLHPAARQLGPDPAHRQLARPAGGRDARRRCAGGDAGAAGMRARDGPRDQAMPTGGLLRRRLSAECVASAHSTIAPPTNDSGAGTSRKREPDPDRRQDDLEQGQQADLGGGQMRGAAHEQEQAEAQLQRRPSPPAARDRTPKGRPRSPAAASPPWRRGPPAPSPAPGRARARPAPPRCWRRRRWRRRAPARCP